MNETYRGYRISYNPKPIPPSCGVDYDFCHEDYDGPGDPRCGNAASVEACMAEIDAIEDDSAHEEWAHDEWEREQLNRDYAAGRP